MKLLQDFFTKGVEGICAQGKPAITKGGIATCRYRAPDGSKCIIGQSIADEDYEPNFEGKSVAKHPPILMALGVDPTNAELANSLGKMQRVVHDMPAIHSTTHGDFMFEFKLAARKFALLENLELPPCLS